MPIHEYEPVGASCDHCRGGFEVVQAFSDPPLVACPECGNPCRKVLSAAFVNKRPLNLLSPKNLADKGFTQYRKDKQGVYRKTAGRGPDVIRKK